MIGWLRPLPRLILAICALLVLTIAIATPGPARASDLLMVTGVAADDVLNLRAEPSAQSEILDTIPPDALGVRPTGATQRTGSTDWREVVWYGTTGWVAARYVAPERISCAGTEPFWGLTIAEGGAIYRDIDATETRFVAGERIPAVARLWPQAVPLSRGGRRVATAILDREICSDGMSDIDWSYSVLLILQEDEMLSGCCRTGE